MRDPCAADARVHDPRSVPPGPGRARRARDAALRAREGERVRGPAVRRGGAWAAEERGVLGLRGVCAGVGGVGGEGEGEALEDDSGLV